MQMNRPIYHGAARSISRSFIFLYMYTSTTKQYKLLHTMPYHAISYHSMSNIPCHATTYHIVPYHTMPYKYICTHKSIPSFLADKFIREEPKIHTKTWVLKLFFFAKITVQLSDSLNQKSKITFRCICLTFSSNVAPIFAWNFKKQEQHPSYCTSLIGTPALALSIKRKFSKPAQINSKIEHLAYATVNIGAS